MNGSQRWSVLPGILNLMKESTVSISLENKSQQFDSIMNQAMEVVERQKRADLSLTMQVREALFSLAESGSPEVVEEGLEEFTQVLDEANSFIRDSFWEWMERAGIERTMTGVWTINIPFDDLDAWKKAVEEQGTILGFKQDE